MGMAAILVICDQDRLSKLSFLHPIEAPYGIWLWLAQWFLRRGCLKSVDDNVRRATEAYLFYKLTKWAFGSGELKTFLVFKKKKKLGGVLHKLKSRSLRFFHTLYRIIKNKKNKKNNNNIYLLKEQSLYLAFNDRSAFFTSEEPQQILGRGVWPRKTDPRLLCFVSHVGWGGSVGDACLP